MDLGQKLKSKVATPAVDLFSDLTEADKTENRIRVSVAKEIISARKKLGYSQKELAKKLGVSQAMVSQYESGDCNFTIESLCRIALVLGLYPSISFSEVESSVRQNDFQIIPEGDPGSKIDTSDLDDLYVDGGAIA